MNKTTTSSNTEERIAKLEAAVCDYAQRYGLTNLAREALACSGSAGAVAPSPRRLWGSVQPPGGAE